MKIVALVPVKALARAKGRLAPVFTPTERADFMLRSLAHVLRAIAASGAVAETLVVSPDARVLALAAKMGATPLPDESDGLNPALDAARVAAIVRGADAILAVHADLPRLLPDEIAALVDALPAPPAAAIARDHTGSGTNALLLAPPDVLPFAFGPDSFARHRAEAARRGLLYVPFFATGIAGDVDTPEDMRVAVSGQPLAVSRQQIRCN